MTTDLIPLTDDTIATLKSKHRRLRSFSLERGGQVFVVRAPSEDEFHRAIDKISDGGSKRSEAVLEVGEACLVFPESADLRRLMSEAPGLAYTAGNQALELAGISEGYGVKKL